VYSLKVVKGRRGLVRLVADVAAGLEVEVVPL
jgi:hypothetical protein